MTEEDKKLLLKDLCARLPYSVWCDTPTARKIGELIAVDCNSGEMLVYVDLGGRDADEFDLNNDGDIVKPYLRPMSSMTEEEEKEINDIIVEFGNRWFDAENADGHWSATFWESSEIVDYLNAHHFDYRGLIEKGLAIEVTPENNPYKTK